MSETKPSSQDADKLAKQLKDTLAQRRPRPWKPVLILLAICTLLLLGLSWWYYPRPRLDPLQIVALDELIAPDEKLRVRAQLYAGGEENTSRLLRGLTMVFLEPPPLLQPAGATLNVVLKSDEHGEASSDWPVPKTPLAEFRTHHINLAEGTKSIDHARVFVLAKNAPIFLVDADETLIANEMDEEASKTLARAAEKGWNIVYLSLNGAKPADYRKARDWIIAQPKLPRGPILGRPHFAAAQTADAARLALLQSLRARFTGDMAAVVKSVDSALASKEAGLPTYQFTNEPLPGIVGIGSWADVPLRRE